MKLIFTRLFLKGVQSNNPQMMSENYKRYGDLFQVDAAHFEEFYALLKDTRLLKSDFFLKEGENANTLVLSGKERSGVFTSMIRDVKSISVFISKMNSLPIMKAYSVIPYPI